MWTMEKPSFDEECIVVTAVKIKHHWEYSIWQIKRIHTDEGSYMGWLDGDGNEYGGLADIYADKYLILPNLKEQTV